MKSEKEIFYKNRGVERNKRPLKNKIYYILVKKELSNPPSDGSWEKYKFKDLGYLALEWQYEGDDIRNFHGFITPEELKTRIGEKQWSKFCQGKRTFIIQRRIDGKNKPKNKSKKSEE